MRTKSFGDILEIRARRRSYLWWTNSGCGYCTQVYFCRPWMSSQTYMSSRSDDLILTSFPQRWEQPKNDPLNVLNGVIEDMSSKTRPPVRSVYDLAMLITGRCIGVFDRHAVHDGDYQFLDMFESSIGEVVCALEHFYYA